MPTIILKETITKKVELPIDIIYEFIDRLTEKEKTKLIERLKAEPVKLMPFKKDKIESILSDFIATDLYEDNFLKDLKDGLKKSSVGK